MIALTPEIDRIMDKYLAPEAPGHDSNRAIAYALYLRNCAQPKKGVPLMKDRIDWIEIRRREDEDEAEYLRTHKTAHIEDLIVVLILVVVTAALCGAIGYFIWRFM